MEIIWLVIGLMVLAGAFFALSNGIEGLVRRKDFVDKDADGEPDERDGPRSGV
ncbi:hypothetical protein [Brevundimonas diminuta]|jgi:hypothetical protein|uniref:hypothetical protein n=1 Tax=Brevundimonas diminuta TaxID=293 RepID=UPI00199C6562|nr:hypothetical protein [Brevundimonas diminuta]MBD3818414.1 hypothetical protein [Brevundimonas diminuta]